MAQVARGALVVLAIVLLTLFLWKAAYVILLLFAATLIAVLLVSVGDAISRLSGLPRSYSAAAAVLLLVALLVVAVLYAVPNIMEHGGELWKKMADSLQKLRETIPSYYLELGRLDPQRALASAPRLVGGITGVLSSGVGGLLSALVVFFTAAYLALTPSLYVSGFLRLVPCPLRKRAREIVESLGLMLRWWLIGQLISMSAIGILVTVGLWLLNVPLAFTLGLLAFIFEFVPYFGPIAAAAPAVLLASTFGLTKALHVVLLYFVAQEVEAFVIQPLVQRKTVRMPPVLTIISITLFGLFFGALGFLLATPLMAVTLLLTKMIYIQDILQEQVSAVERK